MKIKLCLMMLALGFAFAPRAANTPDFISIAVLDFESKDEAVKDLGPKAAALINAQLSREPDLVLVERAELEKVLSEQELGLSGAVSADTAAKVGHLTGAKILVTGRVFKVENEMIMVAKVIGTETSRVFGEIAKANAGAPITESAEALAKKIGATVSQKSDLLIPKVETREVVVEKIRRNVKK